MYTDDACLLNRRIQSLIVLYLKGVIKCLIDYYKELF